MGEGIGLADGMFITNEEWMSYEADVQAFAGLSAPVIVSNVLVGVLIALKTERIEANSAHIPQHQDLATGTDYAVGALTLGGFEKTIEVNPLHTDYVIFSPSGVYHDDTTPTVHCI